MANMRRWAGLMKQVRAHGLLTGVAAWSGTAITRRRNVIEHPHPPALDVQPVRFHSYSGAGIRACLFAGSPGGGRCYSCMGAGVVRRSMLARARFRHTIGHGVLLPDFQAQGESEGRSHPAPSGVRSGDCLNDSSSWRPARGARCTDGFDPGVTGVCSSARP